MKPEYCKSFTTYQRRQSQLVDIGGIPMGGGNPIRIQSMTNTLTSDVEATADQIERIYQAGADYVRVTVPARKDVERLEQIMNELGKRSCPVPVVADIHFNPQLANLSAGIVHKVRINPGNFVDRKNFQHIDYSEEAYAQELDRLKEQFLELLTRCRQHHTALRIGTNHGSLSDRIMSRFGDTPEGMAESAMEFLRICHHEDFRNVVVSMKASNTRIMVYATRILLQKMEEEGMQYPLHLGVTEAGEGEDGRIRSAVGIGTLLADGIGETIRVSLTEDPEDEIPVARKLVDYVTSWEGHEKITDFGTIPINPYTYQKRYSAKAGLTGGDAVPVVVTALSKIPATEELSQLGWQQTDKGEWKPDDLSPDLLFLPEYDASLEIPPGKFLVVPYSATLPGKLPPYLIPLYNRVQFSEAKADAESMAALEIAAKDLDTELIDQLKQSHRIILVLTSDNRNAFADLRSAVFRLMNHPCDVPVIFKKKYAEAEKELFQLKAAVDFGGLFIDGLGDGIWIENETSDNPKDGVETGFGILQASRVRVSKTEYISCPSCGRTLFDLQATTRKIRQRTDHLKGLKIGIMGCIVNGPGEMADANYGYVGTGKGKVTLYKEKEVVKRNIPEAEAVDELINLIKENGDWVDP